jgi:glycosyltransferase involved in cell wall biosynthesis
MIDSKTPTIRLLAIIEAKTVTGPAKNLLEFCRVSRSLESRPVVATSVAAFTRAERGAGQIGTASNEFIETANATGLEVHSIPERFAFDPQVVRALRKLVKLLDPDIIQTHQVKSHFLVRLSGVWRTRHWIAFHHGYTRDAKRTLIYNQLDRWSLRVPSQIVTVCRPFKVQLSSIGVPQSRITVLHNAISPDWLNERGKTDELANAAQDRCMNRHGDERLVLAVGRLSEEKAFTELIFAMDQLRRLRPDLFVRLVIVGDGPEKARIERTVRGLNLQDRVALPGHVPDIRPYYRGADIVAISSLSEGSPNALLEAMAAGVPVVATSVGGIPEIVTDKQTAILVEPRNPVAMASAMNLLLSNRSLSESLVCKAREVIKTRHSPQCRTRFLVDLYKRVCCNEKLQLAGTMQPGGAE